MHIEGALCDLGASVSIMPLPLFKKLQLQDLQPIGLTVQFVDHSIRRPVSILEDVSVQMGKFVIPCDFIVMNLSLIHI